MTPLHGWWSRPAREVDGSPVVLALHGRGADEHSLAALAPDLPPDVTLVCPRGPWPEAAGYAWWQMHTIGYPVAASLAGARRRLRCFVAEQVPTGAPVVLLGFSDGATTAFDLLLSEPGRFAAAALLGGPLPWSAVPPPAAGALADLPVLFGYGADDDVAPRVLLERTAWWLRAASGARAQVVVEPGLAHAVSTAQVGHVASLLTSVSC